MKILIGTPIHQVKDYCMEKWLKNVSQLQEKYPADLLLVDNSPSLDYLEKVKEYLKKYKIQNYQIKHLKITQEEETNNNIDEQIHERVTHSQEFIRQYVLSHDYDAWFSWECDQIIPVDSLDKLIEIMKIGNFMIVNHNCWNKNVKDELCFDLGVSLVRRDCLKNYGFLLEFGTDPEPDSWYNAHAWYRKRLKKDGVPFIDLTGIISPILHL